MVDDGLGYSLDTPSIFIGFEDGEKLRKYS